MMHFRRLLTAAAVLVLSASPVPAQDASDTAWRKLDRSLRQVLQEDEASPRRVIVTVAPGREAAIRRAIEAHGDLIVADAPLIGAVAAEVHGADVMELARHPWVLAVADDAWVSAGAAAGIGSQSGNPIPVSILRETLGLPQVPARTAPSGSGIGVVIIDSGIAPLGDFRGRISAFYDFTRGGRPSLPYDDFGHGTHVAGLIGSSGAQSNGRLTGVAPGVHFIGLKVLNRRGQGRTSDVIAAIEFAVANKARLRADVMNISLGHPVYAPAEDDPLVQAVERAVAAGYVVVVSAGNVGQRLDSDEAGYTGITSPGNAPSAITVGAADARGTIVRRDDAVAPYSSRGPTWFDAFAKPDLVAPGHRLVSNVGPWSYLGRHRQRLSRSGLRAAFDGPFDNIIWGTGGDNIIWGTGDNIIWGTGGDNIIWGTGDDNIIWGTSSLALSGSSMAAGVTSGVVATLLEANRAANAGRGSLTPNTVKAILQFSAIPVDGADLLTQGAGAVNAAGAIALAGSIDNSSRPGAYWLRSGVSPSTVIGGERSSWSMNVIWGDAVLAGDLVYYNAPAWAATAQWGLDNIVWGTWAWIARDNIVWGTADVWATHLVRDDRIIGQRSIDNIVWGTDNIIWGTLALDNIVWGTWRGDNIIWGTWADDNIVWGTLLAPRPRR
jgi:serine protease AprX